MKCMCVLFALNVREGTEFKYHSMVFSEFKHSVQKTSYLRFSTIDTNPLYKLYLLNLQITQTTDPKSVVGGETTGFIDLI